MKVFKKIDGTKVDVVKHTLSILKENPNMQVHIGTDSQNKGPLTVYAVVIAYRFSHNGVHYITYKESVPRINDMWSRLWKEAELTLEVAEWFTSSININVEIDLDFNKDKSHDSHPLISAAKGWAESLGYKVNCKPDVDLIATKAADVQCR